MKFITKKSKLAELVRLAVPESLRPIGYLTLLVRERTVGRVRCGPFSGLHYPERAIGSAYLPKLLGTYERELAPVIEEVCSRRPSLIIDVGAAEGYYAIGLARRNPQARVIAFEQEALGRSALEQAALLNGVHPRVQIRGRCGPAELEAALAANCNGGRVATTRSFVLCDIEGDELVLLNPAIVPALKHASVLVETHDFVHAGTTDELRKRFDGTHLIRIIQQEPRSGGEFPFRTIWTSMLPRSYLDWAMSEWRPVRMNWLWMTPHE